MNNPALDIQRYSSGLMTPKEAAAFERAVEKSPELQKEFDKVSDTLVSMYRRISDGMPAPDAEIKDILLAKIAEPSRKRGAILVASGASIALTPDVVSDNVVASGGALTAASQVSKKVIPFFSIAVAILLSVWVVTTLLSTGKNISTGKATLANSIQQLTPAQQNVPPAAISSTSEATSNTGKHFTALAKKHKATITGANVPATTLPAENASTSIQVEEHVAIANPPSKEVVNSGISAQTPPEDVHTDITEYQESQHETNKFSFSIQHFSTLKFYPGRLDMATRPDVNDWGVALKYAVSPVVAIGLEAGREKFPFYRETKDDAYDEFYSFAWGGMSVTVTDPNHEILNCHPEARALLGFSDAGPMAKLSAGFIWQPLQNISFSPELEYTEVYIKHTGVFIEGMDDVTGGGKLGFTVSAIVHF